MTLSTGTVNPPTRSLGAIGPGAPRYEVMSSAAPTMDVTQHGTLPPGAIEPVREEQEDERGADGEGEEERPATEPRGGRAEREIGVRPVGVDGIFAGEAGRSRWQR